MRILYTNPFLPFPLIDGGRTVSFNFLQGLSKRGHELTMIFPLRRPADRENLVAVEALGRALTVDTPSPAPISVAFSALWSGRSLRIQRHRLPGVTAEIERALTEDFDVAILDTLFTTYLAPTIRHRRPHLPIVMIEHNVETQVFDRLSKERGVAWRALGLWEARRIRAGERRAAESVDAVFTLSEDDARTLQSLAPAARSVAVGAGINTFANEAIPHTHSPTVLFLGSYTWPPNCDAARWLAEEIWPRVRARQPQARLVVAGNDPSGFAASLTDPTLSIEGRGFVDSATATTRAAQVVAVPLRAGSGVRVKILEALANERPVVTTTLGVEGLPLQDGVHVSIRDTADDFADELVTLLENPRRASELARAGRRRVEERFSWEACAVRLETALEETIKRGRVAP